jgi:hypothetical protein
MNYSASALCEQIVEAIINQMLEPHSINTLAHTDSANLHLRGEESHQLNLRAKYTLVLSEAAHLYVILAISRHVFPQRHV